MMSNTLNLLPHNERASKKVQEKFKEDNFAAVVHATGTGKNYITLDLILNNPDKKFLFLAPSIGIIEHIQNIIKYHNLNLDNVEFRTYQSLIKLSQEELKDLDIDYLILDEFHHIGAPIWGNRIKSIIDTHENLKVLGLSAYTVRNRGRENEKDLACPYTDEIFSGKVVSTYELSTAILDKVLPLPTYKTAYVDYSSALDKIKSAYSKINPNHRMYNAIKEKGFASAEIICDSAQPGTIAELKKRGLPYVKGAKKGQNSIRDGIARLQDYHIVIHPQCANAIIEFSNYCWSKDKISGQFLTMPEGGFDHLIDALRYATEGLGVVRFRW